MGQGLRRASWSEGGGCGGAAGFSFGERPGSNGGSAGRWLLPFPGNGPGTGGVFLGRRGRAAAGRRASFSGRGGFGHVSRRHRYSLLSPAACVSAPRRLPPRCLLPPPPLLATPVAVCLPAACRFSPPVITRRLPPATSAAVCVPASACRPAASHQPHPLPAISAAMRRPGGQMGCGGTPRGRSGRDASPARSSAK